MSLQGRIETQKREVLKPKIFETKLTCPIARIKTRIKAITRGYDVLEEEPLENISEYREVNQTFIDWRRGKLMDVRYVQNGGAFVDVCIRTNDQRVMQSSRFRNKYWEKTEQEELLEIYQHFLEL